MARSRLSPATTTAHLLHNLTGRQHTSLTGRAAAGMWAALRAWGFHDRVVLLPANTCYMVLWAVLKSGNRPLLVDVDPFTGNIDITKLPVTRYQLPDSSQRLPVSHQQPKPAAIIPCHMYGLGAPMKAICEWARIQDVKVIEDAALAVGTVVEGRPAGSWGDAAVFSFGLSKIVDNQVGGALVTDDVVLAREVKRVLLEAAMWDERLRRLTNEWHGLYWSLHQYEAANPQLLSLYPQLYDIYGDIMLYRLTDDDWEALPGLLRGLSDNLAQRMRMAALYDEILNPHLSTPCPSWRGGDMQNISTLTKPEGSVFWKYPLLVPPEVRDDLLAYLWEQGIHEATRWYPPLRHMMSALASDVMQPPTPGADRLGASIINLPLGSDVDGAYVRRVAKLVIDYLL